jgi:hypothetical protein
VTTINLFFLSNSRLRDLQLKQNLAPLRNTLSKAMSGGAKAVSTGRSRFMKGVDAFWNDFERGPNDEPAVTQRGTSFPSSPVSRNSSQSEAPFIETTTQQAGRLFSNFSSFISRKSKEFSQAMEESVSENNSPSSSRRTSTVIKKKEITSDDDNDSAAFVDVGQMYPFETTKKKNTDDEKVLDI